MGKNKELKGNQSNTMEKYLVGTASGQISKDKSNPHTKMKKSKVVDVYLKDLILPHQMKRGDDDDIYFLCLVRFIFHFIYLIYSLEIIPLSEIELENAVPSAEMQSKEIAQVAGCYGCLELVKFVRIVHLLLHMLLYRSIIII